MLAHHALSDVASLVGEPSRAAILLALIDRRALPAGELAQEARLSPAATSLHLAKLTQGGLLSVRREGRHRYYRIASDDVAHAIEALGLLATSPPKPRPLSRERAALRQARTCYDHLAGVVAVDLADCLERGGVLQIESDHAFAVTPLGATWLVERLAIDVEALPRTRRPLARRCLDWTERRPHVAGALGAALLDRLVAMRWVARLSDTRAVRITAAGDEGMAALLR